MKILLEIAYNGSGFAGFQVQPEKQTVQSALQDAIEAVYGERLPLKGCSRTDAGVHALQYFATYECEKSIPTGRIPFALNAHLDARISVRSAREVAADFHVRHDVAWKEYEYILRNTRIPDPFMLGLYANPPKILSREQILRMKEACPCFVGRHDFCGFMSAGSNVADTVREIRWLEVIEDGELIRIRVAADGFLYNMVRIIVGTLLDIAYGKIAPDTIEDVIASCDRARAGFTAPPEGLYLRRVEFFESSKFAKVPRHSFND